MRIIGGKYRGKKLISPTIGEVRPTSDKARESLFNILRSRLGSDFYHLKLIDVFAGTGAFGLEAVSQGFAKVVLVDKNTENLQKNVKLFADEQQKITIVKADTQKVFMLPDKYNVLFMDAPYHQGLTETALENCKPYLENGALCLIEVAKDENIRLPENYVLLDERHYGIAKVLIAEFTY